MPQRSRLALIGALLLLAGVSALAQQCNGAWWDDRRAGDDGTTAAGQFDYYALVMSWSPTHCSTPDGADDAQQCSRRDGRRYAFVLHGLWPQYERGFPESCRTHGRPYVPQPVIDAMLDVMPSKGLIIHEYRKHGTCSGLAPDAYFQLARRLFQSIRIPSRYVNPFETQFVSPDDLVDDLVGSNPGLKPDMVAVSCGGPGGRLEEVRICFTREGRLRNCGANEEQRKLCRSDRVSVPPVRSTKRSD
jgi:ribonuclease T2